MPLPDAPEARKPAANDSGQSLTELLAQTASGGEHPEVDDPITRLRKRVLEPVQKTVYRPLNHMIDRLGYLASVVLFVVLVGGGWLGLKFWSDPEDARRMLTVARYYLDARRLSPPRDADTADIIRELTNQTKDNMAPANRNSPNGSYGSWTEAQMVVSLQGQDIVDPKEMSRWFESQTGQCACWKEFNVNPAHSGATAWVLLAYSRMGVKPTESEIEVVLANQHKPGWWPMFPATDDPGNASTYATSLSIWSLNDLLKAGLIAAPQKEAVARAVAKGRAWLMDNAIPGAPGRWKDYPNGIYGQESVSVSGLVLHALHKTPGPEPAKSDANWMAHLAKELPMPKDQSSSSQTVITTENGPFGDPTHYFTLPWLVIGTVDAYKQGTLSQRAQAARLFHQVPDRAEAIARDLKNMPWLAAETLIGLRYLRGDHVI